MTLVDRCLIPFSCQRRIRRAPCGARAHRLGLGEIGGVESAGKLVMSGRGGAGVSLMLQRHLPSWRTSARRRLECRNVCSMRSSTGATRMWEWRRCFALVHAHSIHTTPYRSDAKKLKAASVWDGEAASASHTPVGLSLPWAAGAAFEPSIRLCSTSRKSKGAHVALNRIAYLAVQRVSSSIFFSPTRGQGHDAGRLY